MTVLRRLHGSSFPSAASARRPLPWLFLAVLGFGCTTAERQPSHGGGDTEYRVLNATVIDGTGAEQVGLSTDAVTALADTVRAWVGDSLTVGAEILVMKDRRIVLHDAIGWRDREAGKPMRRNSVFRLLAMTKPFTGTAALMLVEDGLLELDAPVSRWLESWANDRSGGITVRQLLTHTAGWEQYGTPQPLESYTSLRAAVDAAGEQGPQHQPAEAFRYSDVHSYALGALVAEASGIPVERFIEERILEPLGLHDTYTRVAPDTVQTERVASRYRLEDGTWRRSWSPAEGRTEPFFRASGGLYSTVFDYARWLEAWMAWSRPTETALPRLVSHPLAREALTPAYGPYGLHWEIQSVDPLIFGHGGVDGTHGMAIPSLGVIVIYLSQSQGTELRGRWTRAALAAVAPGLELRRPIPSVPAARSGLEVVELPASEAAMYVGRYEAGAASLQIFEEEGRLHRHLPTAGSPRVTLVPLGNHTFAMGRYEEGDLVEVHLPLQRLRFLVEAGRSRGVELLMDGEVRAVLRRTGADSP